MPTHDNELDLTRAELFADGARGIYIPQFFAQSVKRALVRGVSQYEWDVLEAGHEHDAYWDVWTNVLDNATLDHPNLGRCTLHQDGDLWVVPDQTPIAGDMPRNPARRQHD